jgi:hypothetical protein
MENQRSPRGSPRGSPRVSPRVSPRGRASSRGRGSPRGSPRSDYINPIKIPKPGDSEAMLLWRATVNPIDNIGEPYFAQWVYPEERPLPSRFRIQQDVRRYMMLEYNNPGNDRGEDGDEDDESELLPGVGWWTPGQREEYVYFPTNGGEYDEFIPSYYVIHDPMTSSQSELNRQYVSPVRNNLTPLGELDEGWVNLFTQQLFRKGKQSINNFIKRYIKTTRPYSERFTPEDDRELRNNIARIFKQAGNQRHDEAEDYVWLQWQQEIEANPENGHGYDIYNRLGFDSDFFNEDFELGLLPLYNKKGDMMQPANKAELKRDFRDASHYISKIKQTPSQGTRRRRNQRKRDKKILKEYNEDMRRLGEDPDAIFDGGYKKKKNTRKRRRTMRK